ncbi:MAG: hypothetical protein QOJ29_1724 [Thermoleophilaceae bacterium]|nr:hypothetical protein [Thermoleophilaceae bacterium]
MNATIVHPAPESKPTNRGIVAGSMMLTTMALGGGVGAGVGALVGAVGPLLAVGVLAGVLGGIWVVYKRFGDI